MKTVKKTAEYTIFQRKDERYAIKDAQKKWINADAKVAILQAEGLAKKPEPKPEPVAEEAAETTEESSEG